SSPFRRESDSCHCGTPALGTDRESRETASKRNQVSAGSTVEKWRSGLSFERRGTGLLVLEKMGRCGGSKGGGGAHVVEDWGVGGSKGEVGAQRVEDGGLERKEGIRDG